MAYCLLMYSCNTKSKSINLEINNAQIDSVHDISSLIDNVNFTKLQEVDGEHIGTIFTVRRKQNYFLVYDRLNVNKIFLFNDSGKYLKTVARTGFGKEDAINISDFWFNNKGELEVYDYGDCRIFQYDSLFNLVRIKKAPVPVFFISMHSIPRTSNYIGYATFNLPNDPFNGKPYHIAILDSNMKIINTDLTFGDEYVGVPFLSYPQHFYKFHDTLRFIEAYNNSIKNVTAEGISTGYKISYSSASLPDDIMPGMKNKLYILKNPKINPKDKLAYLKKYYRFAGTWLENNKYIYLASRDSVSNYFLSLVSKADDQVLFSSKSLCETERYKLQLPPFLYYDEENDEFIGVTNGADLYKSLYSDSKLASTIVQDPLVFYLVRVKLK